MKWMRRVREKKKELPHKISVPLRPFPARKNHRKNREIHFLQTRQKVVATTILLRSMGGAVTVTVAVAVATLTQHMMAAVAALLEERIHRPAAESMIQWSQHADEQATVYSRDISNTRNLQGQASVDKRHLKITCCAVHAHQDDHLVSAKHI
jgi:hypothetical protein